MEGVQQAENKAASAEQKTSALFSRGWLHFTTAQRFRSSFGNKRLFTQAVGAMYSHKSGPSGFRLL
jgi:hypothetical protein